MIRLARNSDEQWAIYSKDGLEVFNTIEDACSFLVSVFSFNDDIIDEALIQMYGLNKRVAVFTDTGVFQHVSDY